LLVRSCLTSVLDFADLEFLPVQIAPATRIPEREEALLAVVVGMVDRIRQSNHIFPSGAYV